MAFPAARPVVTVQNITEDGEKKSLAIPQVFLAPIRQDIVQFVHTQMAKNRRQPYAVSPLAGHQHSAESWGTGRAVARIPRVAGSGTARAGQGAFGNMCRKGRLAMPTKTYRKWHRRINTNQKRYATVSALAASALPALVMARGHRIERIPEVPLVLDASVESIQKTKDAVEALKKVEAYGDVEKAKYSRKLRAGKGKMRGRRYVQRRGPLVVYANDNGIVKAFRNLPGVELCHVSRLNLLQLAPGGHLGRLIVWTEPAFQALNSVYGGFRRVSEQKLDYTLPLQPLANSDITRIINSDAIQSVLKPKKTSQRRRQLKKNPLRNFGVRVKLNPYALTLRRAAVLSQQRRERAKKTQAARKASVQKALQRKKIHAPNKKHNYHRIADDEAYVRPSAAAQKQE